MQGANTKALILLIVVWSVIVHLPGLASPLMDYHAYRQCQTASMARNYVRHGMHFLTPELDTEGPPVRAGTEFPIYSFLLAMLFKMFGIHDILGRLLSSFFAAWGAVYLYLFVRERFGQRIALWSALVLCAIPIHIYFTRTVQPEPMALWGFLGFLYYGDQWLHRHGTSCSWWLALFMGALAPLLKLSFIYLVAPMWFFIGYERFGPQVVRKWRWTSLFGLILILTEAWYHYAKTAAVIILPLTAREHITNLAPIFTFRLWEAQFISRIPELVTTYSGLVFIGMGIYYFRKAKTFSLLMGWLAASGAYVVLLGEYGLIHRYTLLPLAPVSAVCIACGISALWDWSQTRAAVRVLTIVLVIGIPIHAVFRIAHWYRVEYRYLYKAHDELAKISRPTDLVLESTHDSPVSLYYLDRFGYAVDPARWTPQEADGFLAKGVRFVFIPLQDNPTRLADWKSYLSRRAELIQSDSNYLLYRIQ